MHFFYVATRFRYVLVEAANESDARTAGTAALHELYADLREKLGREVPIEIYTLRPAAQDEIELWQFHQRMINQ